MLATPPAQCKRTLKVGLHVPNSRSWDDTLTMARRAAEVGFDSLWLPDHLYVKRAELWITAGRPVPPGLEDHARTAPRARAARAGAAGRGGGGGGGGRAGGGVGGGGPPGGGPPRVVHLH